MFISMKHKTVRNNAQMSFSRQLSNVRIKNCFTVPAVRGLDQLLGIRLSSKKMSTRSSSLKKKKKLGTEFEMLMFLYQSPKLKAIYR